MILFFTFWATTGMKKPPLISVITPCLNTASFVGGAIDSVLAQSYPRFEHIVVDGGSQDGTVEVLQRYPHVKWISEPDRGQSDAMNKGFALSKGEIIVYLNADDFFEPLAFAAVAQEFEGGADFVVGQILGIGARGDFLNDPKVELDRMLRWWQNDAFCYNSAGYFFRRWVLESVGPFNVEDHYHMDFEFLIEARRRCAFTKIAKPLATFRLLPGTKTFENYGNESESMQRFDKYLTLLDAADREVYLEERAVFLRAAEAKRSPQ
jgi:glycosyltransferase involved in cell wall biosynthesis